MERISAIVVEDERLPRLTLLQKLADFASQVEIVKACENYDDAKESILQLRPDLLFLDIQLHGHTCIDLLKELARQMPLPYIIFTTAYDDRQYLMSAIKLQAVDYLLKPVGKGELAQAIQKVTAMKTKEWEGASGRITLRTSTGLMMISASDIAYIKAARNYAVLVGTKGEEMLISNLSALEQELSPKGFARIDRSTLVNLNTITQLNTRRPACTFKMTDGTEIEAELTKVGIETLMELTRTKVTPTRS